MKMNEEAVQLVSIVLRLLQRAPQPVPVLCEEPRTFPHFEKENRISESSWTSDTTHSTDVTASGFASSGSSVSTTTTKKGANENYQTAAVRKDDSSFNTVLSMTANTKDAVHGNALTTTIKKTGIEICAKENPINRKDEVEENLSHCPLTPQQENSNSKAKDNMKHQLQRNEDCSSSRNTLGLGIQGDSEYWEKFRYSKDYQSSLLIECICNEVFNLKPGPRYKSLMKLSEATTCNGNESNISKNKKEIESPPPQLPVAVCSDDNNEKGIKVEILEMKKEPGTKEGKSILPHNPAYDERREKGEDMKRKVENAVNFEKERHQQKDEISEDNDDDDGNNDGNEMERARQQQADSKIRSSITSSVFTTATATSEGTLESDRRRKERKLVLDGFGQTFHGYLTKCETEKLLRNEGQYLIRQMWNEDAFILSFMFDSKIWNYRIICYLGMLEGVTGDNFIGSPETCVPYKYYLEDRRKCYHSVDGLVREGLITLHLDENAGSYIDLLVELAQFQRNDNLLQTPPAVTPTSRKASRSASFRTLRLTGSSSSALGTGGGRTSGNGGGCNGVDGDNNPSITDGGISMDIALLIHYFEEEIFDGLAKCQVCTNGIWGPSNKGLRCRDCNLSVHESCIDNVKSECKPDLTALSPFSTDLTSLVKGSCRNNRNEPFSPPYILTACINEVEARGLTTEGIYRICGSVEEIEMLKSVFEKDKINTTLSEFPDIHSITGLMKFFLRQLPDPLITQDTFEEFTKENSDSGEMKIDAVQGLVRSLPPAHRLTLKYLLEHLQRVAGEKTSNKMNAFNLSSVLMPSILCPSDMTFAILESGTKLIHLLITHAEQIFK